MASPASSGTDPAPDLLIWLLRTCSPRVGRGRLVCCFCRKVAMYMSNNPLLYLNRQDVGTACKALDSVAIIREMFRMPAAGQTTLPDEASPGRTNASGEMARSLHMPGCFGGSTPAAGTKIMNGDIDNPSRGIPRASGLTLLFGDISARITCGMEGADISILCTVSVTLLAAEQFNCQQYECVVVFGSGIQAQAHLELLLKRRAAYPLWQRIALFNLDQGRMDTFQRAC